MVTGSFCHVNCTNSIKLGHISVVPDSHEVWPLGKLLKPSLTTLGTPWWHMTSVVILSNTLTCIYQSNCCKGAVNKCAISKGEKKTRGRPRYTAFPSGKQRQKKFGRGRPTASLIASVRTPVINTENRIPACDDQCHCSGQNRSRRT
jgi:hypothetical protein